MSDDDRLAALFKDAASDAGAPPPAFSHHDVVAASHRIGRRRVAVARGALGVLIVAGIGLGAAYGLPRLSSNATTSAASAPAAGSERAGSGAAAPEVPGIAPAPPQGYGSAAAPDAAQAPVPLVDGPPITGAHGQALPPPADPNGPPVAAQAPGGGAPAPTQATGGQPPSELAPFSGKPLGPGTTQCADQQDPAVRTYVEQVLPEVAGASEAPTAMICRPGGERGVNLEVSDAGASGLFSVVYLPAGDQATASAPGGASASGKTASGGTVTVSVRPNKAGAPAPFAGRIDSVVAYLVPRL